MSDATGGSESVERQPRRRPTSEADFRIIQMFIDNAKTYMQLSGGGLAVSVVAIRELSGAPAGTAMRADYVVVVSWIAFLISIGSGVFYQYLAVKHLEVRADVGWRPVVHGLGRWVDRPWPFYMIMLVAFYVGAITFVISAANRLSF